MKLQGTLLYPQTYPENIHDLNFQMTSRNVTNSMKMVSDVKDCLSILTLYYNGVIITLW